MSLVLIICFTKISLIKVSSRIKWWWKKYNLLMFINFVERVILIHTFSDNLKLFDTLFIYIKTDVF